LNKRLNPRKEIWMIGGKLLFIGRERGLSLDRIVLGVRYKWGKLMNNPVFLRWSWFWQRLEGALGLMWLLSWKKSDSLSKNFRFK
jgi:hypothetical protein